MSQGARPNKPFVIFEDEEYTFGQTHKHVTRLANLLYSSFGVRKGDRGELITRTSERVCVECVNLLSSGHRDAQLPRGTHGLLGGPSHWRGRDHGQRLDNAQRLSSLCLLNRAKGLDRRPRARRLYAIFQFAPT